MFGTQIVCLNLLSSLWQTLYHVWCVCVCVCVCVVLFFRLHAGHVLRYFGIGKHFFGLCSMATSHRIQCAHSIFLFLSLSLSRVLSLSSLALSCTHSLLLFLSRARASTLSVYNTHSLSCSLSTHTLSCFLSLVRASSLSPCTTHAHTLSLTVSLSFTHSCAQALSPCTTLSHPMICMLSLSLSLSLSHTHTHTHTFSLSLSPSRSLPGRQSTNIIILK